MLKAVYFVMEPGNGPERYGAGVASEIRRAVRSLREEGFASGIRYLREPSAGPAEPEKELLPAADRMRDALLLSDDPEALTRLRSQGYYAAGYLHAENEGAAFSGVPYVLQEPDLVDADSYCKIYEREAGLPWTILETQRCLVREFTEEDLEGICALYDKEARRFLEPPSEDHVHERAVLRAYIRRIYGLYGFGHWAVLEKSCSCPLIGRIGFSAITAAQEKEALELGIHASPSGRGSGLDADFGFLVGRPWRGRGIAEEVCRALLRYGFSSLGFARIRADARADNTSSIRLLKKLGFVPVGTVREEGTGQGIKQDTKVVFVCENTFADGNTFH